MSTPGRSAPTVAGRLRRLARLMVLFAAAVGAGFLLAALFDGPAAASGMRGGAGDDPQTRIGALVQPVARLTVARLPDPHRQRATGADARRDGHPDAPLAGTIAAAPRDAKSSTPPRQSKGVSPALVSPPRVDATGAAKRARLRPASPAPAGHRPALPAHPSRPDAAPPRRAASTAPATPAAHGPADPPTVDPTTAPLPHLVDTATAALPRVADTANAALPPVVDFVSVALPHVVEIVPIRPVVLALLGVIDAVLAPVLDVVVVPAAPPPPALRAPGPPAVPVADPTPAPTVPAPPAPPAGPTDPTDPADAALVPVSVTAVLTPAAPPRVSVAECTHPTTSTRHLAARPGPVLTAADPPGGPVAPVDQDAAGVDDGSTPGLGLVRAADRQSHLGVTQARALLPLLVEGRTPSGIARPG
ncbi:hypothetical protein [Micromonospora sp. NPDC048898]|uniref:hypothetical protein n=1 Tax=Micromonospora sp. NPDC048898 TaxID=3364260 RepID=UPI003710564A